MAKPEDSGACDKAVRKAKCTALCVFMLAVLAVLVSYIANLQLFRHQEMDSWAQKQQDVITVIPGERGTLLDRNGVPLNKSIPAYSLALRIEAIRDPRDTQQRTLDKVSEAVSDIASFLGPDFYRTRPGREAARRHILQNTPMPFILWHDIERDAIDRWSQSRTQFPGTELVMSWKRHYAVPDSAYHVRGMTTLGNPIYPPEFKRYNLNYLELIGRSGLEEVLNPFLAGYGGFEQLRTDVLLYRREVIDSKKAVRGEDVKASIDIELQQFIEGIFRESGYSGALALMDLRTSQVVASVSEPSAILGEHSTAEGTQLNRVLAGYYPPGSTLKPLVAMAALENGLVTADETIECRGGYSLPDGRNVACTAKFGHGPLNLEQALARSCNVYFCVLADRLGIEHFDEVGRDVGLGERPMTELKGQETAGIRFSPEWVAVNRQKQQEWTIGDAANGGIGQGGWIVTPMQLLIALSAVVTGKRPSPTFVISGFEQPAEDVEWQGANRQLVLAGMRGCVEYGTGRSMAIPGHVVYAKTGTAQVGAGKVSHALAYAAVDDGDGRPLLACSCIVEHGGGGGKVAGPVVRQALQKALEIFTSNQ